MCVTVRNLAAPVLFAILLLNLVPPPARAGDAPETIAAMDSVAADSIPLAGNVVYVDFWASWCVPCRESFPWMKALLDKYHARGLRVITVNLDRKPDAGKKFLKELNSPLPVVFDSKGSLAKRYHLAAMPTSFVYGRDGKLRTRHEGFRSEDSAALETLINTLLEEKPTP
jgi:thiol-disulfide isomerase/thioredoxin